MPVLKTSSLSIGYIRKNNRNVVQSALSLTLKAGEMVCLIGPNGTGKSTILSMVGESEYKACENIERLIFFKSTLPNEAPGILIGGNEFSIIIFKNLSESML